jgi:hypothetical protein
MIQVVECLLCKLKALSSNLSSTKKKIHKFYFFEEYYKLLSFVWLVFNLI